MRATNLSQMDDLLEAYYLPLFQFAVRLCGSSIKAFEMTHRAFNLARERSRELPVPANRRGWLFSILFHDFLEHRPRERHA
jgi:DNA-directed RNA polymerase specialized sigma24 family protein